MNTRYTFFYVPIVGENYRITCGRIVQVLSERLRLPQQPQPGPRPELVPDSPVNSDSDSDSSVDPDLPVPAGPARAAPVRAAPGPTPEGLVPLGAIAANIDDASDTELWDAVRSLQWRLVCDGAVDARQVASLLADIARDGRLTAVRMAFARLALAIPIVFPHIAETFGKNELLQLIGLGYEMVTAACTAPDVAEFVKNELQGFDLAALLGI